MSPSRLLCLLVGASAVATPAYAVTGTLDAVPAATLLYPWFEVDLEDPAGRNTMLTFQATDPSAVLTHVTVWSDLGIPVLGFDVYLTGFDVQTLDMRDVLSGVLPATATHGQDPSDAISPQGASSQDINFASCTGTLPPPQLSLVETTDLQAALTGAASTSLGGCAGLAHGDRVARGYVTVDTVNQCSTLSIDDPGYLAVLTGQNVLMGEMVFIDETGGRSEAELAAHLEADDALDGMPDTFYGPFVGFSGLDKREPLKRRWTAPYMTDRSEVIVFRQPALPANPFGCTATPFFYPLDAVLVAAFDASEDYIGLPSTSFPSVTGRYDVGGGGLPTTAKQGMLLLDLATAGPPWQAYVLAVQYPESAGGPGQYVALTAGTPLDDAFASNNLDGIYVEAEDP